jgi:hypothetical protein
MYAGKGLTRVNCENTQSRVKKYGLKSLSNYNKYNVFFFIFMK